MNFIKWLKKIFYPLSDLMSDLSYCYRAPDNSGRIFKVLEGIPFKETHCYKGKCNCDSGVFKIIEGPTDTYFKEDEE